MCWNPEMLQYKRNTAKQNTSCSVYHPPLFDACRLPPPTAADTAQAITPIAS